jgi:DNA gyrase inhibitor GyrI
MTVPAEKKTEGEISLMTIPEGRCAAGEFLIDMSQYGDAWNSLFGVLLPAVFFLQKAGLYIIGINLRQQVSRIAVLAV